MIISVTLINILEVLYTVQFK